MNVRQHNTTEYEGSASALSNTAGTGRVELSAGEGGSSTLNPDEYNELFGMALDAADRGRGRSAQSEAGIPGPSGTFGCPEQQRLLLRRTPHTNTPKTGKAKRGTYLHAGLLEAQAAMNPGLLIEPDWTVTLSDGFTMPAHPDLVDPDEPSVADIKTGDEVNLRRRIGPDRKHIGQLSLYWLAGHQAGILPPEGTLRVIYVDADDVDKRFIHQEPFSVELLDEADEWWQSVRYAAEHDEPAPKEWPIPMCRDFCAWFDRCRGGVLTPLEPIRDPDLIAAAKVLVESKAALDVWNPLRKQATGLLAGISGQVGSVRVKSQWINATEHKQGHWRVEASQLDALDGAA
jgi:hypothetical protein